MPEIRLIASDRLSLVVAALFMATLVGDEVGLAQNRCVFIPVLNHHSLPSQATTAYIDVIIIICIVLQQVLKVRWVYRFNQS